MDYPIDHPADLRFPGGFVQALKINVTTMSEGYRPVLWNRFKKQYDLIIWVTIILYLLIFVGWTIFHYRAQNINTTLIRAFGTLALLLLHVILATGPLTRLSPKFLPILYNRRHLGVTMFLVASVHAFLGLLQFHSHGNINPLISLFTSNIHYNSFVFFPFQTLGFFALIILAAMAFTSHDFWLHFLGPRFWKTMHMMVYIAYALILLHVALGIIQFEKGPVLVALLIAGLVIISGLHIAAAIKERRFDENHHTPADKDWKYVCHLGEIPEGRAKMTLVNMERVAIFKYNGKLSAVHNVCKHQLGPLGEGKIVDGCIICPWHGYQYKPEDGRAPAPFTEKIATYRLKLLEKKVFVNTAALPEGTFIEPLLFSTERQIPEAASFFIGWAKNNKGLFVVAKWFAFLASILFFLLGVVFSASQKRLGRFQIDYSNVKKIEGWLSDEPVTTLRVILGKDGNGNPLFKSILLVDAFKFGADAVVKKALNGQHSRYVRLTGYLSSDIISCSDSSTDCTAMCSQCITGTVNNPVMEIDNGVYSFESAQAPVSMVREIKSAGTVTLLGQIIDPKCYFGAMNPGEGKTHLSCAVRCISGGIMPVLLYKLNGRKKYAILLGLHGEPINGKILKYVALPIKLKGSLSGFDDWGVLRIDPETDVVVLTK